MTPRPARIPHDPAQVSLMQGDVFYTVEPKVLATVLGSCVAVCLWDAARGIGGMNHFVLPKDPRGENNPRYGTVAIDQLVAGLMRLGSQIPDLKAKVFGGANVLAFGGVESVGTSNVRLALKHLRLLGIQIAAKRTGGTSGQQIRFNTRTGEVMFRYLTPGPIHHID